MVSAFLILAAVTARFCSQQAEQSAASPITHDLEEILQSGELKAVALEGSASYFSYKGLERGQEFYRCLSIADSLELKLRMSTSESDSAIIESLISGKADVMVSPLPVGMFGDSLLSVGPYQFTRLMLLERGQANKAAIDSLEELKGKTIHVSQRWASSLKRSLDALSDSTIQIISVPQDSISEEDMVQGLFQGTIEYMAATEQTAEYSMSYYPALRAELPLSGYERLSWAVRSDKKELAERINHYLSGNLSMESPERIASSKRLYQSAKGSGVSLIKSLRNHQVSDFDDTFKKVASEEGIEWRLLAAIAYTESSFDSTLVSRKGAVGVMQVMPGTLERYTGKQVKEATNYDIIKAAALVLKDNKKAFAKIPEEDRIHFLLAAYNSGIGHLKDAQALCEKYGRNPLKWEGNVEDFIRLKSQEAFYQDSICKFGFLNGSETVRFVKDVESRLELLRVRVPSEARFNELTN